MKGAANPNWKGGLVPKTCGVCGSFYEVKRANSSSRFCSLQCVGISQRKTARQWTMVELTCAECAGPFAVPASHAGRYSCCSSECRDRRHAKRMAGAGNANWRGGLSRLPYPWNFREISRRIIDRDGGKCRNPDCSGADPRLTAHHINYDKQDCADDNLIALCSACNSKANFGRAKWQEFYSTMLSEQEGEL